MKLKEIQSDVLSVAKQLEEKYNTSVVPDLRLNEENIGEIILSFKMKVITPQVNTAPVEAAPVAETEAIVPEVVDSPSFAVVPVVEKKKRGRKAKAK